MPERSRRLRTRMWDTLCQISRCALAHLISKSMLAIISAGSSGGIQLFTRASRQWVIACSLQARGSAIGLSITGKPQDVLSSENNGCLAGDWRAGSVNRENIRPGHSLELNALCGDETSRRHTCGKEVTCGHRGTFECEYFLPRKQRCICHYRKKNSADEDADSNIPISHSCLPKVRRHWPNFRTASTKDRPLVRIEQR